MNKKKILNGLSIFLFFAFFASIWFGLIGREFSRFFGPVVTLCICLTTLLLAVVLGLISKFIRDPKNPGLRNSSYPFLVCGSYSLLLFLGVWLFVTIVFFDRTGALMEYYVPLAIVFLGLIATSIICFVIGGLRFLREK